MLPGMLIRRTRVLWFTLAAVALFMVGCGAAVGTGEEPETPAVAMQDEAHVQVAGDTVVQAAEPAVQPTEEVAYDSGEGTYADTDPSALTQFRDELSPHGAWVEDPVYGLVWVPKAGEVGADFAPYVTAGHWALTAEGDWLWVSDYSWGWVAFHYGRWVWLPSSGWAWIPGRAYAPAWVVWRVGEPGYEYIGWAPMPPSYYWSGGVAVSLWIVPPAPYVFCETEYVFDPYPHHHILVGASMHNAAGHTHHYHSHHGTSGYPDRPHGPSMGDARVPASAVPRTPATPHPNAVAASRPRVAAAGSSMAPSASERHAAGPTLAGRNAPLSSGRAFSAPTYRGQGSRAVAPSHRAAPLVSAPAYRAAPAPSRATPGASRQPWSREPRTSEPQRPVPSYAQQPAARQPSYGRPSYGAPSRTRPSYSAPSYGRPSYQPPSRVPAAQQPYSPQPRGVSPVYPSRGGSRPSATYGAPMAPTQAVAPRPSSKKPSSKPSAAPAGGRGRRGRR